MPQRRKPEENISKAHLFRCAKKQTIIELKNIESKQSSISNSKESLIITSKLEDRKSKEPINFLLTNDTERELLNVQEICNDKHLNEYEAMDFDYHYSDREVDFEIDACNINTDICDDMKADSEIDTSSIDTDINLYDDREENFEINDRDINLHENRENQEKLHAKQFQLKIKN